MLWNPLPENSAASITREASPHTYYTIRFLVDRGSVMNAFRAYAYFRWLDDRLDSERASKADCLALVERQWEILRASYRNQNPGRLSSEERLLIDLIRSEPDEHSGLRAYINNMMAVMEFDAQRRGKLITNTELGEYTQRLSIAVTEAMHYFIGRQQSSPRDESRYPAVIGAHITHMLRDTHDDIGNGYFNIPLEFLGKHSITPHDVDTAAYRDWVKYRVKLARKCFTQGRESLARVENLRCRIAELAYIGRFERVLTIIEQDDYRLRAGYEHIKSANSLLNRLRLHPFLAIYRATFGRPPNRQPVRQSLAGEL